MVSVPEKSVSLVWGHSLFSHQFPQKVIKHWLYFSSPIGTTISSLPGSNLAASFILLPFHLNTAELLGRKLSMNN